MKFTKEELRAYAHDLPFPDGAHRWLFARCRDVEKASDSHLDLWTRGHYQSTFGTLAESIQQFLSDPEITIPRAWNRIGHGNRRCMHAFCEMLLSPPEVELLRVHTATSP